MANDKAFECPCGGTHFLLLKSGKVKCATCEESFIDIEVKFPDGIPD